MWYYQSKTFKYETERQGKFVVLIQAVRTRLIHLMPEETTIIHLTPMRLVDKLLKDIGNQNFYYLYLLGILTEYLISYFVAFSC
jgi:hypothetical protein